MAYYSSGNITLSGAGAGTTSYTLTGAGGGGYPAYTTASVTIPNGGYTLASGSAWTTQISPVNINSDGISLNSDADIKIGNMSLKETLEKLQERFAILVPDPNKLEKYEALKQAYEHYKTLEALCTEPDKDSS